MQYLRLFFQQLYYSWTKKLSLQLTTVMVLTGSFLAVGLTLTALQNFYKAVNTVSDKFEVSVYLEDNSEDEKASKVKKIIESSGLFSEVRFIDKEQALNDFKTKMKSHIPSFILEEKEVNPLPSSFSLKMKKELNTKAGFEQLNRFASSLLTETQVDDVSYGQAWMEKYASFLQTYKTLSFGFILFLLASVILIIGNSIKSSISQRRKEIEVLELVGATKAYIRMPFILEGAFLGFLSASISILLSYFVYVSIVTTAKQNMGLLAADISVSFLNAPLCALMCFLGAIVGAMGAAICIQRLNTGWAAVNE